MSVPLSLTMHTVPARMSDGDWRMGHDLASNVTLGNLERRGFIRCDFDTMPMLERVWAITPEGMAALEATQ